jgi:hypothetical protein
VKVTLGTFARSGIEAFVGSDIAAGVRAALIHYAARLRSGLKPVRFPRFCAAVRRGNGETAFEVPLDPEIERSLELEARRQNASLEQLVAHAVLVYLADLDRAGVKAEPDSGDLQLLGR